MTKAKTLLEQRSYHLVHYAGPAIFDQKRPEYSYLNLLDGEIRAIRSAGFLAGSPTQFFYLSCCSGAEIGNSDVIGNDYLGLIHGAIQVGVPAVLGYCWALVGRSAKIFAGHFYGGLAQYPSSLEHAIWWARRQIVKTSDEGGWDGTWFSSVLIVQNPDHPGEDNV